MWPFFWKAIFNLPPLGSFTPSLRLPSPRKPSSIRDTLRAFWPSSLDSRLKSVNLLIPIEVIEEIDHFKRESSELGQNARSVSRMLDGFRGEGSLSEG